MCSVGTYDGGGFANTSAAGALQQHNFVNTTTFIASITKSGWILVGKENQIGADVLHLKQYQYKHQHGTTATQAQG
jgi:hypothetical protein